MIDMRMCSKKSRLSLYTGAALCGILSAGAEAQTTPNSPQAGPGSEATPSQNPGERAQAPTNGIQQEIVITAEKRSEPLLKAPIPVSVLSADQLTAKNETRLQDYFSHVPGVTMTDMVGGTSALVIRGITTGGFGNPTVGTTIDDAPVGFSTGTGGGYQQIDLDPSDLQSVEVLRGPQGSLYGASSMGGLLRYVTRTPSVTALDGRVEGNFEGVDRGGLGGGIRGGLNVPLAGDLAASFSGFWRHEPGWIDDPTRSLKDINKENDYGGRFALFWQPTSDFSLKLNAIHQEGRKYASDDVAGPDLGALHAGTTFIPGSSGYRRRVTFLDGVADWRLGPVDLTNVAGYSDSRNRLYLNLVSLSAVAKSFFGQSGVPYVYDTQGTKFSEELRASIPLTSSITWLLGGFYTKESSSTLEWIQAGNLVSGQPVGTLLTSRYPTTYREFAEFTNLTINFTPQFNIQLGARESEIRQTYSDVKAGPLAGATPITPVTVTKDNAFTYLITPQYKITNDVMVYARVATGYRAGGPNFNAQTFGLPTSFQPDKTTNYDLGLKGSAFGHILTYDASLYYIDWKNIQIREITSGFASVANAGGAKSEGAEVELTLRPARGLSISGWISYDDAVLTSPLPPQSTAKAYAGDRLPYTSRWSGNLSVDQRFPLSSSVQGFVGASADFVGDRLSDFTPTDVRTNLPAYTKVDLEAGAEFRRVQVNLYIKNLLNRRGIIAQAYASPAFHIIAPRTIGADVKVNF